MDATISNVNHLRPTDSVNELDMMLVIGENPA
jgi:hypothetical protein